MGDAFSGCTLNQLLSVVSVSSVVKKILCVSVMNQCFSLKWKMSFDK